MLFIQIPTAFAAEGGYFDKRQIFSTGGQVITELTDNNLNTSVDVRYTGPLFTFFDKKEDVVKVYVMPRKNESAYACYHFYSDLERTKKITTIELDTQNKSGWIDIDVKDVRAITITKCDSYGYSVYLSEVDFVVKSQLVYEPISKVSSTATHNQINLSWTKPEKSTATHIMVDGKKIAETTESTYTINNLLGDTNYKVDLVAVYPFGVSPAYHADIKTSALPVLTDKDFEIVDILANSARLVFKSKGLKNAPEFIYVYDSKGNYIGQVGVRTDADTSYKFSNLESETKYTYQVKGKFGDLFTDKVTVNFTTPEGDKEVTNLNATATAQEVSLVWKMPVYKNLDVARIYRQKEDTGMIARFFSFFAAESKYEPIFETNGTTFKDLTVKADKEYTYKVTTVDKLGNETDGKTVVIKTKKMAVSGGGIETDENGDYVITWTSPTSGKIKVLVGGEQYAIVAASDKKIVIPKEKMKFDLFGKPDVKLVPVDDDGTEGEITKPGTGGSGGSGGGGGLGEIVGGGEISKILNPENVLKGGVQLLAVIGGFVLLGLAFRVVPKLVRMIRNAFSARSENIHTRRRIEE